MAAVLSHKLTHGCVAKKTYSKVSSKSETVLLFPFFSKFQLCNPGPLEKKSAPVLVESQFGFQAFKLSR